MSSNQEKVQSNGGNIKDGQEEQRDSNSGRSRSRSNGRKRSYNAPSQGQSQQQQPTEVLTNAQYGLSQLQQLNMNQGLQQLQEMANKKGDNSMQQQSQQAQLQQQGGPQGQQIGGRNDQLGFRHARRLYIGNIPETINQEYLSEWLYRSLEAAGGLQPILASENPILKCEIDPKGRFAFTEMRSVEETSALLQLDGIILWHRQLRIRRPTEYENFPQITEGRVPKLNFDLFKTVGIVIIPTVVEDGPNKIFLANLPTKMDELMILDELKLRDMGEIKAFHLVKDNQTNQSKGYAFFEFKDSSLTERAINSLHGMSYAGRQLTCKRSQQSSNGGGNNNSNNNNKGQGGNNNNSNNNNTNSNGGGNQRNNNRNNNGNNHNNGSQMGIGGGHMQRYQDPMMEAQLGMQSMMMGMATDGSGFFPNYNPTGMGIAAAYMGGNRRNFPNQQPGYQGMSHQVQQPQQGNSNNNNNNNSQGNGRRYPQGGNNQMSYGGNKGNGQMFKGQQLGGNAAGFDMNQMYAYQQQQFMMHDQQNQFQ